MRSSVQSLNSDIQKLRNEIDLGPILDSAINAASAGNSLLRSQQTARSRRIAYVHGIVSIYGLIEEHIDALIMEVASAYLRLYSHFNDLPDSVRLSHREYSLRVLLDSGRVRLREPVNEVMALNILAANYNNAPLQLTPAAFTYATANYRHPYIVDLMRRLDIDASELINAPTVQQALVDSGLVFRDIEALLHDLVERRNEIVHSYQALELLDVGVLTAYLDVVAEYLRSLFSIVSDHLLQVLATRHLKSIGNLVKCWTATVGVDMTSGRSRSPSSILIIKGKKVLVRTASSLQSNGNSIAGELEYAGLTVELGIAVNERVPATVEGGEVFVLPDEWLYLSI